MKKGIKQILTGRIANEQQWMTRVLFERPYANVLVCINVRCRTNWIHH